MLKRSKLTSSALTEKNGRLKHNRQQQEQFFLLQASWCWAIFSERQQRRGELAERGHGVNESEPGVLCGTAAGLDRCGSGPAPNVNRAERTGEEGGAACRQGGDMTSRNAMNNSLRADERVETPKHTHTCKNKALECLLTRGEWTLSTRW